MKQPRMSEVPNQGWVVRCFLNFSALVSYSLVEGGLGRLTSDREAMVSAMQATRTGLPAVAGGGHALLSGGSPLRTIDRWSLMVMLGFSLLIPVLASFPYSSPELANVVKYGLIGFMAVAVAFLFREAMRARMLNSQVIACEQRWLTLLECAPFPILKCCSQGRIEYANQALLRAIGYQNRDIVGRDKAFLPTPTVQSDCSDSADVLTPTGLLRGILWSHIELRSPGGSPLGTLWIGRSAAEEVTAKSERDAAIKELTELRQQVEEQNRLLEVERDGSIHSTDILGQSDAIRYVLHKIGQVASTNATVLIEGETGVGKELVAHTIHENSARRSRPLIIVNCAALPPSLIESELFGHEKGSFTGADRMRQGRFELAEGGTLFLDEIGELGLDMQAKLLRVLQEGEYMRVGGTRTIRANVRVIAATNVNLEKAVEAGRFRKDLYYRLQVFPITVPALRDRREDIPELTQHFVEKLCRRHDRTSLDIRMEVINRLTTYDWPGNVRELENVIERAVITSAGTVLTLPRQFAEAPAKTLQSLPAAPLSLAEMERRYIKEILVSVKGQVAGSGGAAEILGLHPNTLRARMAKLGVSRMEPGSIEPSRLQADRETGEPTWILTPEAKRPANAGVTPRT